MWNKKTQCQCKPTERGMRNTDSAKCGLHFCITDLWDEANSIFCYSQDTVVIVVGVINEVCAACGIESESRKCTYLPVVSQKYK